MDRPTLTNRVKTLEKAVEDIRKAPAHFDALEAKAQTLDVQFTQFHSDVRLEFSAVHEEITAGFERVDGDFIKVHERTTAGFERVDGDFINVHERITAGFERVDADFVKVHEEFAKVREEIRQGDEETRRFMRVLHEDLVGRITVLGEQFRRT